MRLDTILARIYLLGYIASFRQEWHGVDLHAQLFCAGALLHTCMMQLQLDHDQNSHFDSNSRFKG